MVFKRRQKATARTERERRRRREPRLLRTVAPPAPLISEEDKTSLQIPNCESTGK